jgi:polysaccharide biosynthesis protein PslH
VRILFLTPDVALPADQGAKLRNSALIRLAAAHHQVDLVTFGVPGAELDPELTSLCGTIKVATLPDARSLVMRGWNLVFGTAPDIALRLESMELLAALQDMCEGRRYDVVQIEGLEMTPYVAAVRSLQPRAAVIYDAHNAEMSLQRSMWQVDARSPARWHRAAYSFFQWSKLGTYERLTMNECDAVLCVSDEDAAKLKGRHVDPKVIPNGVDIEAIPYREPSVEQADVVFFAGAMGYRPNADAVGWLTSAVLPRLRALAPTARVRLAGKGTERIRREGVDTLGYVEDFGSALADADVLIAPLRMGSGSRFKVLEAMAAGVPVVATKTGVAGIGVIDEEHALVADTAQGLAECAARVLQDRELARRLARQARGLVESRYDWAKIGRSYLSILTSTRHAARQSHQ